MLELIVRLEERDSQRITANIRTLIRDVYLPIDEIVFQEENASG